MSTTQDQISEFCLVGQLMGFVVKDGYKVKYLRLSVAEREYWIKISKEHRSQLSPDLSIGSSLEVTGISKRCRKTGKFSLRAHEITLNTGDRPKKSHSAKILVCEKSSCWKRGAEQICQVIAQTLKEKGLESQVEIKRTGCLKQCKEGPNLITMPDKVRYSKVKPQEVPSLLEKFC